MADRKHIATDRHFKTPIYKSTLPEAELGRHTEYYKNKLKRALGAAFAGAKAENRVIDVSENIPQSYRGEAVVSPLIERVIKHELVHALQSRRNEVEGQESLLNPGTGMSIFPNYFKNLAALVDYERLQRTSGINEDEAQAYILSNTLGLNRDISGSISPISQDILKSAILNSMMKKYRPESLSKYRKIWE